MKKTNLGTKLFFSFFIALFFIALSVKITLNFKALYYFDINYLNIEQDTTLEKTQIIECYNYLINYLNHTKDLSFNLPHLPSSKEGVVHFQDVKKIFIFLNYCFYFSLLVFLSSIFYMIKKKEYLIFKYASNLLLAFIALLIPFSINFDKSFTLFHKLLFSNDYWLFNPDYDPIILILPQEFFFHSAALILILILFFSLFLRYIFKKIR